MKKSTLENIIIILFILIAIDTFMLTVSFIKVPLIVDAKVYHYQENPNIWTHGYNVDLSKCSYPVSCFTKIEDYLAQDFSGNCEYTIWCGFDGINEKGDERK